MWGVPCDAPARASGRTSCCRQARHVLHRRCLVEALAGGGAPAPPRCPEFTWGARHTRPDALEAAVQARPGLHSRAERMGRGVTGDADLRRRGLWCGWDQHTLRMGSPLNVVTLDGRWQRFGTGNEVPPQLTSDTRVSAFTCLTQSTTPSESTFQTWTWRRRSGSCGRLDVVHLTGPAAPTRLPHQQATEVRVVVGERRHGRASCFRG